ncbi:hypothetical protein [Oryzihumus leptocrescens]|uniref:Uncharacterized protein n=1 Tax=Oryzihumus leptocrescens TaxID=297536 RepID=A0A542ZKT3_9MICO|nr:hypothetical protein [Oryzihumus leptocrescens]TQL60963.1 hypothetical protein FB474_2366 [Oryzihumus leptocrescens]
MTDETDLDSEIETLPATDTGEVEDGSEPATALVQIADDLAVFFGAQAPDGLDLIPFTLIDEATRASLSSSIANAAGFGNAVAQGVNGMAQAQGLVRLAPQTLEQLKTAAPLVKDGWNLGTLADGGKFVAQVRWLPAAGATAASVIASLGPALTLMAIQFQLNQISELAQHNLALTSKVLEVVRQEQWSEATGYHNTLIKELAHAREVGVVTDSIYKEICGYQGRLSTQWDLFERAVRGHVNELRAQQGHKQRQQYLIDHGEAMIADVQALLLAQTSWFTYQALRAGHLLNSAASNPQDEVLLKKLVEDARDLHSKTLEDTDWLLEQLAREFAVIGELPGKRKFKIGANARAAKDVAHMVRQLQRALAAISDAAAPKEPEPLELPSIRVFERSVPEELKRILPLRLQRGERIRALADASCGRWDWDLRDAGWVAVTNHRLLITKQDSLRRLGAIEIAIDLEDIRYVRRPNNHGDKAPTLDVITKESNLTLKFESWSKTGARRASTERFGELLASYMQLPASEVPTLQIDQSPHAIEASGSTPPAGAVPHSAARDESL